MDAKPEHRPHHASAHGGTLFTRMREATGTVYGDIGTSVLYTVMEITRETVRLKHNVEDEERLARMLNEGGKLVSDQEAIGGLSLVVWALIFLTVKYDLLIMKADNHGEGGTFALWGLLKGATAQCFRHYPGRLPRRGGGRPARGRRSDHAPHQHAGGLRTARRIVGGGCHAG